MEYRIDDLAQTAGTTVRNVRAYQDRGLLPPPRKAGRVGYYSEHHLARLRTINALLERGYSLGNIAELIETWESGGNLGDLLGLEHAVTRPFTDEPESALELSDLATLFGTTDPALIAAAIKLGFFSLDGTRLKVPSMRLLKAGAELQRSGIPLPALLEAFGALKPDIDSVAASFVALVQKHVFDRYGDGMPPPSEAAKLAEQISRIRPLAEVVVVVELARALERHIRQSLGERFSKLLERPAQSPRANAAR